MEKNKFNKWIFPLTFGAILLLGGISNSEFIVKADTNNYNSTIQSTALNASHTIITINDTALNTAVRNLLGKSTTEKLYADDFLTNVNYKATTTTDEESGVTTTSAKKYQLDLSNTGVTDIRELCKFAFPETLHGINLSGNGISNEHLDNINTFINATESMLIVVGEETITPQCDFSSIIKKVNLNNNNIDLSNISSTHLNNKKLLFGIQNFGTIHSSGFIKNGEMEPMYYIRQDDAEFLGDEHYMSFSFLFEYSTEIGSVINKVYNTPTKLLDLSAYDRQNGKINISVTSLPNSETAYFSSYEFSREFILFDVSIDSSFRVERKSLLNLNIVNGKPTADCPLIVDGFGDSLIIGYNSPSTNEITTSEFKNYVNIDLTYNGNKRTIPVEFIVEDTIAPVIKLIGSSYMYSSKNKEFKDPGYIAYDPATVGADTGDDLNSMVSINSEVLITKLGVYNITYSISDRAGNTASVVRKVEIQEAVLDRINLRTNTSELIVGEDIILVVQPDSGINISNYSNITYYWYLNGTLFTTTKGDTTSGKSTTTITLTTAGTNEITVKLVATQKVDNASIEVFSDKLSLRIEPQLRNNDTLVLTLSIALVLIILVIGIITLIKYKNGKGKITGKHKNFHKGKPSKKNVSNTSGQPEIQVFKDYNGTNGDTSTGGTSGGGNQSFRMPETNNQNNGDGMNK
ncbi:MAG: immunoglobulin-like domain-containing protein [Christensenellales bacterium]